MPTPKPQMTQATNTRIRDDGCGPRRHRFRSFTFTPSPSGGLDRSGPIHETSTEQKRFVWGGIKERCLEHVKEKQTASHWRSTAMLKLGSLRVERLKRNSIEAIF